MATNEMSIKLMINPESNKVLFAEASKEFVDFLLFFLSLPIGTAIKLLTGESMVGSFGNVYNSVANLNETYLQPNINKNVLLNPFVFSSLTSIPLSIKRSSIISSGKFYTCGESNCKTSTITNLPNAASCPAGFMRKMNREIDFSGSYIFETPRIMDKDSKGYVRQETSYMVSDDLSVSVISTMSILSTMNKFNVTKLDEKNVKIGNEEALELLKTAFKSTTVLTDVFMKKKKKIKEEEQGRSETSSDEKPIFVSKMPAKAKKRKTAEDHVMKPKGPPSAFFVFLEDFRKTYKEENPNNNVDGKAGGEKWRQLSAAEKAHYQAECDRRMIDYAKELEAYNKRFADGSHKSRSEVKDEDEDGSGEDDCVIIS